jgi:hypothetical protein
MELEKTNWRRSERIADFNPVKAVSLLWNSFHCRENTSSKALLILIVSIFLVLIGGGIWKRTHMAVAPPIYDPISYYSRAQLVWAALAKGDLHGILNGPLAARPPGTAFVLYPFGFRTSIRGFLLRSVFAPILIWAIALCIPIARQVSCRWDAFLGGASIVGLAAMPLFYHFEVNAVFTKAYSAVIHQWGMVDSLEGAIAALAISLLYFGIDKRRIQWCAIGWLVGAFSFFIKPSGLLVMMALVGVATVEFVVPFLGTHPNRRVILKFAALVYFIGFCIFGVALWLAFRSDYMSREVIAYYVRAQQFLIAELAEYRRTDLLTSLALFVVPVVGWWWFCPGVFLIGLVVAETIESIVNRQGSAMGLRLAVAGMILVSAVCWWIFLAGPQHRYLFPFLLMVVAWFVPGFFQRAREFGLSARGAVSGYCLAPAVLLAGLLWSKQPPIIFQKMMGVNLSAGGYGSEVKQGQWLLSESARLGRIIDLYSVGNYEVGAVEMVDWVKSIENNNAPHNFFVRRPINWVDPPGLRAEDLRKSDFILLEDVRSEGASEAGAVSSVGEEMERFKQFAYSERGVEKNGLELVSDASVKLLRVVDAHKFSEALYAWANSIHWANDFRDRNKAFLEKPLK